MTEPDIRVHRSEVYAVGGVRMWIESLGQLEPSIQIQGDPHSLPAEEMRAAALILKHLADLLSGTTTGTD